MSDTGRRKLLAIDDPLDSPGSAAPTPTITARSTSAPSRAGTAAPEARPATSDQPPALFVRLPLEQTEALARAAFELRVHKRVLVAALVARYVDPYTEDGLHELRTLLADHGRSRAAAR